MNIADRLKSSIRDVADFPKPGILFKDISTIMLDASLSSDVLDHLVESYKDQQIDAVAGIESRGFLFGFPLAMRLGVPFILIRKEGKLPYKKIKHAYDLEYGSAVVEMHSDAVTENQRVLIHDDLLATGGSAAAAAELIQKSGATVAGFSFLVELSFLNGKEKLTTYSFVLENIHLHQSTTT
jgi:adenine phosphoribosyltransferase